ncbi:MAG: diguanylate cyclase [Anaerolineaceae bacterium]|nr:diguanylate cyclase [Anaerolineaceae bacterium]
METIGIQHDQMIIGITIYLALVSVSILFCFYLIWRVWRVRMIIGAAELMATIIGAAVWSIFNLLVIVSGTPERALLTARIGFSSVVFTMLSFLRFSMRYSRQERWLRPWHFALISLPVVFSGVSVLVPGLLELHWKTFLFKPVGPFILFNYHYHWLALTILLYYFAMVFSGLARKFIRERKQHQIHISWQQGVFFFLAFVSVLGMHILSLISGDAEVNVDYTSLGLVLAILFLYTSVFRFQAFELIPVAHRVLMDKLQDAVIVIDEHFQVLDVNREAERFLDQTRQRVLGRKLQEIWVDFDLNGTDLSSKHPVVVDFERVRDHQHYYELFAVPLQTSNKKNGFMLQICDISKHKHSERMLKDISLHDGLTGLNNRFAFDEKIKRLNRPDQFPISFIMADLDDLKEVNDHQGHLMGDVYLNRAAELLQKVFRKEDFIARVGGDEFVVIMPNTDESVMEGIVSRLKREIYRLKSVDFILGLSVGGATARSESEIEQIIHLADTRMYANKRARKMNPLIYSDGLAESTAVQNSSSEDSSSSSSLP